MEGLVFTELTFNEGETLTEINKKVYGNKLSVDHVGFMLTSDQFMFLRKYQPTPPQA